MRRTGDPHPPETAASRVHVRLAIGGVRVEFRGRRDFFDRYVRPLVEGAYARAGIAPLEAHATGEVAVRAPQGAALPRKAEGRAPAQVPAFQPSSPPRFQQFASQVGARAAQVDQRIMAFAFYLWNFEKQDEFASGEVAAFFRTVLEPVPEDLEARLASLERGKRFLEPAARAGSWRLTTKGVNYVKNRLLGSA